MQFFRKRENSHLCSGAQMSKVRSMKPDVCPTPPAGIFSPAEGEGGGGTDALISLPYNERQWRAESPIVLHDPQAVGGSRVALGHGHAEANCVQEAQEGPRWGGT